MRDDDRHVGEIDRDIIEVNRVGVFEAQSAAARHAGADARMAAMEDCRQLVLGNHLIKWIRHPVVREKPWTVGWNLKPRITPASIKPRASRTPIRPLCGSMLATAIMMSLFSRAASATSSFGIRRAPIWNSESTVNITKPIFLSR